MLFDSADYRDFLAHSVPSKGEGRGRRSELARQLKCELSLVSLVLGKKAHFSIEHAHAAAEFLALDAGEMEFFLLLYQMNRAGTKSLESLFQRKIDAIKKLRREIGGRVKVEQELGLEQQIEYYSHWAFTAVHMCLRNPETRTIEKISQYLGIPVTQTRKVLEFLTRYGLARETRRGFESGTVHMHLTPESPMINKHHANWRLRALETLSVPKQEDLHYSTVISMSPKTAQMIRTKITELLEKSEPLINAAPDEGVFTLSIDLFEAGSRPH